MSKIMRDRTYDGKQKLILLAIADMVDQTGVGFASYRMIKEVTDVSDEYLRQSIRQFVSDGRLEILTKGTGPRRATVYRVLLPNSVEDNSVVESEELPNSDRPNSPTTAVTTPQLQPVNSPTPPPNPPSYTSLETPSVETPSVVVPIRTDEFDLFWSIYPLRVGKDAARRAWAKAIRRATADDITAGARRYRDDPNRDEGYTKHPATWLNAGCWDDDPLPAKGTEKRTGAQMYDDLLQQMTTRSVAALGAGYDD